MLSLVLQLVFGVWLALLLFHAKRLPGIVRSLFISPFMMPPVVAGMMWLVILDPSLGAANYILQSLGLPPSDWLASPTWVIPTVALIDTWQWTPYVALIVLGGLQSLPPSVYEAAQIDGASPFKTFRRITLPLLLPTIVTAAILRSVDLLRFFDIIYITTQGGPGNASNTLNIYGFRVGFEFFNIGYASALDADADRDRVRRGARLQPPARRGRLVDRDDTTPRPATAGSASSILLQLVLAGILIMTPTAWMVLSSFKPSFEVTAYPPTLIFSPTLENYVQLMRTTPFFCYALNSLIVTIGSTGLGLLFGIPAAFAVSWTRISWPAILTLAARMAPGTLFLLPWYVMFRQVGMIGSYTALILSHAVITLPIVIWVLLPSFDDIPRSIFEAAQVDGCSVTRILWRIALPLVGSGIAVAAILAFVFSWNYFLFALVLSNGDSKTLIAAAFNFVGEGSTQWGALMAAATLIALPPLVLAAIVQRWLVSGLTLGAVKG